MYLLTIYIPLLNFIFFFFFSRFLNLHFIKFVILFASFLTFFLSLIIYFEVGLSNIICCVYFNNWISSELLNVSWNFYFDSLTSVMFFVVTFISFLVHLYSIAYMKNDPHLIRFLCYLSLFTFFMLILVSSDNFFQLFFGWEGVGLVSYLLINFWYKRLDANKAALKAIIINRIGDLGLLIGIFFLFKIFKSLNFFLIFSLIHKLTYINLNVLNCFDLNILLIINLCFFLGIVGKSAQFGLHIWLPDAMEGPTPVSALIHAATMVTAGVFLLLRCSIIFEFCVTFLSLISFIGSLTAFFGSTVALFQNDLKKIVAYSTCSQLGYMIFSCGLSNYNVALFHLFNHAIFKALLFLCAGVLIHIFDNEQDIRKMGNLLTLYPFVYISWFIGSCSLMGFIFTTGFYSKDLIIELSANVFSNLLYVSFYLIILSTIFTFLYNLRALYLVFFSKTNYPLNKNFFMHPVNLQFISVLFILSFSSLFFGYLFCEFFLGIGNFVFFSSLFFLELNNLDSLISVEFLNNFNKLLPLIFGLCCKIFIYMYFFLFKKFNLFIKFFFNFCYFFSEKWYFDLIYNFFIAKFFYDFAYFFVLKFIDKGFLEFFSLSFFKFFFLSLRNIVVKIHAGVILHYCACLLLEVIFCSFISILFYLLCNISIYFCIYIFKFFFE